MRRMRCQRNQTAQTKKGNPEGKTRQQQPQSDEQNMVTKRCKFSAKSLSIEVPRIFECGKAAVPSRNNVVNPYQKTEPHFDNLALSTSTMSLNVSRFQSSRKTMTNGTPSGIKPSPTKVSLINSIDETNQSRRYTSQPKSGIIFESTQNKLHAYKIDWVDINITTAEAMKYSNFTKIK